MAAVTNKFDPSYEVTGKETNLTQPSSSGDEAELGLEPATVAKITRISSVTTVLVAGLALFSDGYNAQIIGYMEPLFTDLYKEGMSSIIKTRLSNAYLIGEIFGMLFFGFVIDKIGRRSGIVFATFFLVLGVILATAAHGTTELGMFWMMIVARGVAGFGAGGEYPTCGTGSAEASDESEFVRRRRGFLVAMATDFAIDFGFVIAGVVALIVIEAYNGRISSGIWRVCFGLGFVLPVGLFFFRIRMIESTQYRKHAIKQTLPYWLIIKRYWKPMLGTSLAWFCYDFVTYPFGIFSSTIIGQLNPNNTLIQNIGYGTFMCWAILGFILGGALGPIQSVFPLFVVLYGIFNSFGEMGPGVATFLCGAESFPTPLRGHFLGLAAAVGKAGAAIGTQVFTPIQDSFSDVQKGTQAVFLIGAGFAALGGIIAWTLIPDRDRQLDSEDVKFREYLAAHGYEADFGESLIQEVKTTSFRKESLKTT
ncbi:hypothetical protein LTR10_017148 [Elasticomyces elasticus]|uniref:Major facilitator superfamily (MFS) profile domain-containing protein n=1 Tax=Exophiala sideris TaxID=1016849 RepID=A0ABR0JDU4_9EURO|nr:hypothetical protein LTR10_017148 [Elasticomyces elasticus]KAK5032555.1 hypothetical protein LTS07_003964 [Exophiala sideris]KAK5062080.1 hypothetical protein LTR69_004437 [Exophiala sideris]